MIFLTNLQKAAYDHHETSGTDPQGWLLSSHRTTGAEARRALAVRNMGELLMADNGTIEHIKRTHSIFEDDAKEVVAELASFRSTLPGKDRDPAFGVVPAAIHAAGNAVAEAIASETDTTFAAIDPAEQTAIQFSIDPTELICKEDWSVGVALGLGLERFVTGWSIDRYVTRNRQSLRGWQEVSSTGPSEVQYFATLAAPDYPTARAVGREAASWGVENVALGFAGLNKTNGYTYITRRPTRRKLNCPGPRRYVRLAEIVTGFRDGYRDSEGTLQRFHALGLGARPMWPILAAGLDWWTETSIDATSAIKDAAGKGPVLYDPGRLDGRVKVATVAEHVATTGSLPFPSAILESQLDQLDIEAASAWLASNGPATHDSLRSGQPLGDALPLFANGTGSGPAGRQLAAHNYWASELAASQVPARGRRDWGLDELRKISTNPIGSITVRNGTTAALEVLS